MESDERLHERLTRGELDAFDALYSRYERPLFGFLLGLLRSHADAEDVLSETFLAVVRGGESAFRGGSFRAWIYRVGRNRALNRLRGKRREEAALGAAADEPLHDTTDRAPDAPMEARERSAALGSAVARLPPSLGEVYRLRAAGLSYDEMAAVLALPVGTVKSRMHEMVNRLKEEMKTWTAR